MQNVLCFVICLSNLVCPEPFYLQYKHSALGAYTGNNSPLCENRVWSGEALQQLCIVPYLLVSVILHSSNRLGD